VLWLFKQFENDIYPNSSIYQQFLSSMADRELAARLADTLKKPERTVNDR
jgi:hypothetical protein